MKVIGYGWGRRETRRNSWELVGTHPNTDKIQKIRVHPRSSASQKSAVIFGAGSVGRGFLGQLFTESGYEVVFVDVDGALVEALNRRGSYTLRLSGVGTVEELTVGPVRAVNRLDAERVAAEVARASLLATAAGARALPDVARSIAAGLDERWAVGGWQAGKPAPLLAAHPLVEGRGRQAGKPAPLNVIICENLRDAPALLRGYVRDALPDALKPYVQARVGSVPLLPRSPAPLPHVQARVGFVPAVVARMSPVPTREQRAADPTLIVAEPYKVLPVDRAAFVGEIPRVVGMEPVAPFAAYVERKLYVHNAAHAMLGYLGYRRGLAYGYEALDDPWVRPLLDQALDEAGRALVAEHGFEPQALQAHVQDILARLANRALADPVGRLARDPLRKLAPDDRLVGAARLAEKHAIRPEALAWGIAAALAYDDPADPDAVELQAHLAQEGLAETLRTVCSIQPGEPLADLVSKIYWTQMNADFRRLKR